MKVEIDADTLEPKSELSSACLDWCKGVGSKAKTVEDANSDEVVQKAIQDGMDRVNAQVI